MQQSLTGVKRERSMSSFYWTRCTSKSLVFDKHSGELIGFTNLGEINSHLLALERSLNESDSPNPPLANSVMTFMVRGLFSHLQFAYAYFPCHNITGDLLYDPFWEAVFRIERCGFKVGRKSYISSMQLFVVIVHVHAYVLFT